MADTLLTSLCSICHVSQPKYKCPRCQVQTCSMECVDKHKTWSECSGKRDPTAYVPPSKLRTAAGIDHDYNFLYSLDRATEATEKELEEKGLISRNELRPVMVEHLQDRRGRDGRTQKFIATKPLMMSAKGARRYVDDGMRFRLAEFDIHLVRAPPGLSRAKNSSTRFTKARRRIEWQIEWVVVPGAFPVEWSLPEPQQASLEDKIMPGGVRLETKTMDDCPVIQAFAAAVRQLDPARQQMKKAGKKNDVLIKTDEDEAMGDPEMRDGATSAAAGPAVTPDLEALEKRFSFFLRQPQPSADCRVGLRPVHASDIVGENLRGATVFEFPTIYVYESTATPAAEILPFDREALLADKKRRDAEREKNKRQFGKARDAKSLGGVETTHGKYEDPADTTSSEGSDWSSSEEESDEDQDENGDEEGDVGMDKHGVEDSDVEMT
ncbi:putative box C/D snoRNA protein [Ceratocystis fimbriata CBS 114723]|uniref:Box C/D snoRNA protein 1 n=1 Tax=Ceratocystis fimbriata CBS 114723 TaxID=1035309 RepID=A0A2C5X049_9PEZI|nr:putative box C/D snoRNA protein [Ceratocystis fimbriata CBS 114723]